MSKILVKRSCIKLNNYELGDCKHIENTFSVYDRIRFTSFLKGIQYDDEKKVLYLPRGIDIEWLERIVGDLAIMDDKVDPYDTISPSAMKYGPRDERQEKALRFLIGPENFRRSQLSVNLNTGVGKSYCSIAACICLQYRAIIITRSKEVLRQWKNYILEYTNIKPNEIYMIEGSPGMNRALTRSDISKFKFLLVTHGTLKSFGDNNGWDKVEEFFKKIRVGIKIYDEAHLNFDNMCSIDYHSNTFKTFYVTATPARSSEEEDRIFQYYFKNVPSIDLFDEDIDPHTNYLAIRFNSKPDALEISECASGQYKFNKNIYTNYLVKKDNYYKILTILLDMVKNRIGKTLVYIGTNNAIQITYDYIMDNFPEWRGYVGIYSSLVPNNMKEDQLNRKLILSTTHSCGEAMDIKGLETTIVLAEPFKSEVLARQTLGRTRANNTQYIEVVDEGFEVIRRFYYYKQETYRKYALSCSELKLKQDDLDNIYNSIMYKRKEYEDFYLFNHLPWINEESKMMIPAVIIEPNKPAVIINNIYKKEK